MSAACLMDGRVTRGDRRGASAAPRGTRGAARRGTGRCSSARAPGCTGACRPRRRARGRRGAGRRRGRGPRGRGRRELRREVVGGGEDHAHDVVGLDRVAGEQLLDHALRLGVDLLFGVLVAGDRAPQRRPVSRAVRLVPGRLARRLVVAPVAGRRPGARSTPLRTARGPRGAERPPLPRRERGRRGRDRCACAPAGGRAARRPRTSAAPGGCGPRGSRARARRRRRAGRTIRARAGAVTPSSSSTPSRSRRRSPRPGTPSTSARYILSTRGSGA